MRNKFVVGGIYHICNKSIANFSIFSSSKNSQRFLETVDYYNKHNVWTSFSIALKQQKYIYSNIITSKEDSLLKILSYCIMPDHYHLLFKVLVDYPVSKYISDIENSYSRYFNLKYNRKGPLWQSRFRCVLIKSNEQLLHVSRYIHLNPSTNGLVNLPEEWRHSSYKDIISDQSILDTLAEISIKDRNKYKKFAEDNLDYQKSLKRIKKLLLD